MALQSQLFGGDPKLEAAAISDPAHILPGARGPHVGKIQRALIQIDGATITQDSVYGPATTAAVRAFKQKRLILNFQGAIDDIVGKQTMAALDKGVLAIEAGGGDGPEQPIDLKRQINDLAFLLQPVQRPQFVVQANLLVGRSAITGGGTDANAGAIPIAIIALFIIILFMIALTTLSQNPATKQMGREWERRFARLRERIRGKPIEVQTAETLAEVRQQGKDVVKNAQDQRQKCLDTLSPQKLEECGTLLRQLGEVILSLIAATTQGIGRRGSSPAGLIERLRSAMKAVFKASEAAAKCTECDNMVL